MAILGVTSHLQTGMILQLEAVDVSDISKENSWISPRLNNSPVDLVGEKKIPPLKSASN